MSGFRDPLQKIKDVEDARAHLYGRIHEGSR